MILLAHINDLLHYLINSLLQAGLILCQGYVPEKCHLKSCKSNTDFPFKMVYFLGLKGTHSIILYSV